MNFVEDNILLLFLHIFKCGGTFLTGGIRYSFDPDQTQLHNIVDGHPSSYWEKTQEKKNQVFFYHGHFNYGIHEKLKRPCVYITTLRDPVNQLLSIYYNLREEKCKYNRLHKIFHSFSFEECLSDEIYNELSLEDALIFTNRFDNHQTRMLVGEERSTSMSGKYQELLISNEDLVLAKSNLLSSFSFVEVCEEIDNTWPSLNKKLGLEIPPPVWHSSNKYFSNRTEKRKKKEELSPDTINRIYEKNKYDYELFKLVEKYKKEINDKETIIVGEQNECFL